MKFKCLLILFSTLSILSACNNGESAEEEPSNEVESEEVNAEQDDEELEKDEEESEENQGESSVTLDEFDPIPTDVEGLANQSPGKFANADSIYDLEEEIQEEMADIGPLGENPTDEDYELYLRKMYWLVAEDYPDPQDVIKKWEFASFGNPDLPDERFHFKENYNVEIILDSSGSMANPAGSGTRMDVAKESINNFLSAVPEEANVSLRVYGHKGSSADSDKELSCGAIEQVYGFDTYNEDKFQNALNQFESSGWTPLADALKQSQEALSEFDSSNHTNLIYVVSDGIETCDGDPVAVAKELSDSNAQPIINIIGFQTDAEAQQQLEEMAEVTGGIFASAKDEKELQEEFERAEAVLEAWEDWKKDSLYEIDVQRVENNFDIMKVHNDYSFTTLSTRNNLNSYADVLKRVELITHKQKKELKSKIRETMDHIDDVGDQLEEDMKELSKQTIEDAKKTVEERYEKQTSTD